MSSQGMQDHLVSSQGMQDHLVSSQGMQDHLVSSQGMQDHLGAKFGTGWRAEMSTSFRIFTDPAGQNHRTRLRLLKTP